MREALAGNISRFRKNRELTQETLANILGISFQAVSKWETGQMVPDTLLIPAIAKALHVSTDKLLGYSAYRDNVTFYETEYKNDGICQEGKMQKHKNSLWSAKPRRVSQPKWRF